MGKAGTSRRAIGSPDGERPDAPISAGRGMKRSDCMTGSFRAVAVS
jgi:hypothetical protein